MQMVEQKMELDLPTILMSRAGEIDSLTQPGVRIFGAWAAEGKAEIGVRFGAQNDDPTKLDLHFRILSMHYSPPADCPPWVVQRIGEVNATLAAELSGAA